MSAGRLNKKSLGIVMLLSVGLLLAGCSGSKSSDTGTYSGSVYTVKRGDTLYRISRTRMGNRVKSQEVRYLYSEYFADDTSLCQMKLTSFSITTFFQKQEIGYQEAGCYDKASCF
ncbi:TPA: hypothetical protein ACGSW0_004482, partial [Shigella sonnei]